jgi:hypothetical protein
MSLREKIENLENRIGENWMRRIKLIILTTAACCALGCSEYKKQDLNSRQEQEINYSNIFK